VGPQEGPAARGMARHDRQHFAMAEKSRLAGQFRLRPAPFHWTTVVVFQP